jgi:hypothetical protein
MLARTENLVFPGSHRLNVLFRERMRYIRRLLLNIFQKRSVIPGLTRKLLI